jgi:hypothetical protein
LSSIEIEEAKRTRSDSAVGYLSGRRIDTNDEITGSQSRDDPDGSFAYGHASRPAGNADGIEG